MSLMLTRMFAYFTIVCYLVVGTVVARFAFPEIKNITLSSSYFSLASKTKIATMGQDLALTAPEMKFESLKNEVTVKPIKKIVLAKIAPVKQKIHQVKEAIELPFSETVVVKKVYLEQEVPSNLLASYVDFKYEEKVIALEDQPKQDEVSTKMSAPSKEFGDDFFEYPVKKDADVVAKVEEEKIESEDVAQLIDDKKDPSIQTAELVNEPEFFDYPAKVTTQVAPSSQGIMQASQPIGSVGIATSTDVQPQSKVITQVPKLVSHTKPGVNEPSLNSLVAGNSKMTTQYNATLTIQALGSDLEKNEPLNGFEVRFQDSNQESLEDFGTGAVRFEGVLANSKMTRAAVILKRGYVPTTTDLFLKDGESRVTIPLVEEDIINNLNQEFENLGVVGALLIELDDETEIAKLDVPFGKVIKLDGDLKETESENFRYQLFIGVRTGNAMISYHRNGGIVVNKIVHIHENEMVFDANFYEEIDETKVKLNQEDLISKITSPLNVPSDNVKIFATNQVATKVNNQTYRLNFSTGNLAGRRYIELSHQEEPIFVGMRDNNKVNIPSESMIRYMLSQFEQSKLGDRCLVQINLNKEALKFEAFAESAGSSLVLYNQALDSDGKFYESVSEKTRKLVIVGENQSSGEASRDGRINIKIQYADGSDQYLSSYCSPNTYLVEQL